MRSAPAYTFEGSRPREHLWEDVNVIAVMGVEEEKVESARQVTVRLRLRGVAVETEEPLVITLPARNPKKIARAARAAQKTAATSAPPLKEVYLLDYCTQWHKRWGGLGDDDAAVTSATTAVLQEHFFNDWIHANECY